MESHNRPRQHDHDFTSSLHLLATLLPCHRQPMPKAGPPARRTTLLPMTEPAALSIRDPRRWEITPLDKSLVFFRSGQIISNQLRGERFSHDAQLELFADQEGFCKNILQKLPEGVREDVIRAGVQVIGFDLSVPQQRAFNAALHLIHASGGKHRRIVFSPEDWFWACEIQEHKVQTRKWSQTSSYERRDSIQALIDLAQMPHLLYYQQHNEHGFGQTIARFTTLWKLEISVPTGIRRVDQSTRATTADAVGAITFALEFDEVFFEGRDQAYFWKPWGLHQRLDMAQTAVRKRPGALYNFVDFLFAEAGKKRLPSQQRQTLDDDPSQPEDPGLIEIQKEINALALQCRLKSAYNSRQWVRIQNTLGLTSLQRPDSSLKSLTQIGPGFGFERSTDSNPTS